MPRQLIESCSTFLTNVKEFLSNIQASQVSFADIITLQDIKTNLINFTKKNEDHEITFHEIKQIQTFIQTFIKTSSPNHPLQTSAEVVDQTCKQTIIHRSTLSISLLDLHTILQVISPNVFKEIIPQEFKEVLDIFKYLFKSTDIRILRETNFNDLIRIIKKSEFIDTEILHHQIGCKKELCLTFLRNIEVAEKVHLPKSNVAGEWKVIRNSNQKIIGLELNNQETVTPVTPVTPQFQRSKSLPAKKTRSLNVAMYNLTLNDEGNKVESKRDTDNTNNDNKQKPLYPPVPRRKMKKT